MPSYEYRNTILQRVDEEVRKRLHLRKVTLERKHTLELAGDEIRHLYFLESGIGSMTTTFRNGAQVEVGMFGWESVIGVSALIGTRRSLNNIYMQLGGDGFATTRERAVAEFARGGQFHNLVLRFVQAQMVQTAQSAGCNARHALENRLARWLLLCNDRAESDTMDLTQEFLSMMLGTARPAVSETAHHLQERGLIMYKRGKVTILNRKGLEKVACECYEVVRHHLNSYATDEGGG
jgi:CRP-like cAMP-binding protein